MMVGAVTPKLAGGLLLCLGQLKVCVAIQLVPWAESWEECLIGLASVVSLARLHHPNEHGHVSLIGLQHLLCGLLCRSTVPRASILTVFLARSQDVW
jgi:hypothetical protein